MIIDKCVLVMFGVKVVYSFKMLDDIETLIFDNLRMCKFIVEFSEF